MSAALQLYDLVEEVQTWADTFDLAETDEQRAEISARIEGFLQQGRDRVDQFNALVNHVEAQVQLAANEIERLKNRQKRMLGFVEYLEASAITTMETLRVKKLAGDTSTLSLRACPPSVIITDENALDRKYKVCVIKLRLDQWLEFVESCKASQIDSIATWVVDYAPINKAAIGRAIKAGETVPGADLAMGKNTLTRK